MRFIAELRQAGENARRGHKATLSESQDLEAIAELRVLLEEIEKKQT